MLEYWNSCPDEVSQAVLRHYADEFIEGKGMGILIEVSPDIITVSFASIGLINRVGGVLIG